MLIVQHTLSMETDYNMDTNINAVQKAVHTVYLTL